MSILQGEKCTGRAFERARHVEIRDDSPFSTYDEASEMGFWTVVSFGRYY